MGLVKWFKVNTYAPAKVAENAVKQYRKASYARIGQTSEEIAHFMWEWRYANARIDLKSQQRLQLYLESRFPIQNVIDFCLSSFDIEFLFGPPDLEHYDYAANYIGQELFQNNIPCDLYDVVFFVDKLNKYIYPIR